MKNCRKFKTLDEDYALINQIKKNFKEKKITCVKLNHSLLFEYQTCSQYDSYLQLSKDEESLIIVNKIPCEENKYTYESDKFLLQEERDNYNK